MVLAVNGQRIEMRADLAALVGLVGLVGLAQPGDSITLDLWHHGAARAGVLPGDLLLAVEGEPVSTVAQAGLAADWSAKAMALLVQRGRMRLYVPLRPS